MLESKNATEGTTALEGVKVYVDGELVGTTDKSGEVKCLLKEGEHNVLLDNGTFNRNQMITLSDDSEYNMPMIAIDLNKDGVVNAKDYVMISTVGDENLRTLYDKIFMNFINLRQNNFSYSI